MSNVPPEGVPGVLWAGLGPRGQFLSDYGCVKIEAEISSFFQNISKKFQSAHLIITRSGGSTVAEILASCKPAIFVPLPNSFDNHQFENAKFFEITLSPGAAAVRSPIKPIL